MQSRFFGSFLTILFSLILTHQTIVLAKPGDVSIKFTSSRFYFSNQSSFPYSPLISVSYEEENGNITKINFYELHIDSNSENINKLRTCARSGLKGEGVLQHYFTSVNEYIGNTYMSANFEIRVNDPKPKYQIIKGWVMNHTLIYQIPDDFTCNVM